MYTAKDRTPGILLAFPRLKPSADMDTEALFRKWTPLHYRDLLNIKVTDPDAPGHGARFIREVRAVAPERLAPPSTPSSTCEYQEPEDGKPAKTIETAYSHQDAKKLCPYLYASLVQDIGLLRSDEYLGVSRRVDLERTRDLGEGEEPVESQRATGRDDLMVEDLVEPTFAVFKEVSCGYDDDILAFESLTAFPVETTGLGWLTPSSPSSSPNARFEPAVTPGPSYIVAIHLPPTFGDLPKIKQLHGHILHKLRHYIQAVNPCDTFTSVYQYAGAEAQTPGHPPIPGVAEGSWLVMCLITRTEGMSREEVEDAVEKVLGWSGGGHADDRSAGVWELELVMV